MTPYLDKDPRSLSEVVRHAFMQNDTYLVVCLFDGLPHMLETRVGQTFNEVCDEIARGEWNNAVGVVRASMADCEFECVTRKASLKVAQIIFENATGPDDIILDCPFMDRAYPSWRQELDREWAYELQATEDAKYYARVGT